MAKALSAPRMDSIVMGSTHGVQVISLSAKWWEKRQRTGVHIKNPSVEQLEFAKGLARRLGTNTVYSYHNNLK